MNPELDAARAGVAPFRFITVADIAQEAREQRAMDRAVALGALRMRRRFFPAELLQRARELLRDVAPLPHARDGKEILSRRLLHLVLEELRHLEEGEEVRALVGELRMALVGRPRLVVRPLARVLHRK